MKSYQKAIIAGFLTLFFLYKTLTDTAAGHGLIPVDAMRDFHTLFTNLSYLLPLFLSVIWLLRSVREMTLNKED